MGTHNPDKDGKCWKNRKLPIKCPPNETGSCFKFIKKEIPCKPRRKRCEDGVLARDDPRTGRVAGDPCKDDWRYE